MKITHVIWTRFPIEGYGGTERVAYWLGKAQAELGHQVNYLCYPGSRVSFARTFSLPKHNEDINSFIPADTDIVQLYATPDFPIHFPYLVNIGGNGRPGEKYHPNTVFVSANHAKRHFWTEFVHNGLDLSEYPLEKKKDSYAVFLAKASWRVKNVRGALRIAQAAGVPLHVLGGRLGCWHKGVVSHGTISGEKKLRLLQHAQALLFPVIWEEPFGLAVIEALACGTPVVATSRGALPEIVTEGTGFLADSFEELVQALNKVKFLDPDVCRARVEQNFTHLHMAKKYLEYYQKILEIGKIRDGAPQAALDANPEKIFLYQNYCR